MIHRYKLGKITQEKVWKTWIMNKLWVTIGSLYFWSILWCEKTLNLHCNILSQLFRHNDIISMSKRFYAYQTLLDQTFLNLLDMDSLLGKMSWKPWINLKNLNILNLNPLMTTPRRNWTLFSEIKFCTLCLTIISCFEKILMWRIGKVENIAVTYTWHWTYGLQIAGILGKC